MISVKIISTPESLKRLRERGPEIVQALTAKMNELMIRLQSKVVGGTIPQFFKNAPNISGSVQLIPAAVEGTKITGMVQAGGPRTTKVTLKSGREVDYAGVQEYGVPHGWIIEPFNKRALAFVLDGKRVIVRRVFHGPLEARPFMRTALEEMTPEIKDGLSAVFREALGVTEVTSA